MKSDFDSWLQDDGTMRVLYPAYSVVKDLPPFILFRSKLSLDQCNLVIRLPKRMIPRHLNYWKRALKPGEKLGLTGNVELTKRSRWLFEGLADCFAEANKVYGFRVLGFVEYPKVKEYLPGEVVPWHTDTGLGHIQDQSKLTCTIQLSDSEDCKGGRLELMHYRLPNLRQGDVVIFPSFIPHRVTPIIEGSRYSLACWWAGPAFV